jgi:hypothetical protein
MDAENGLANSPNRQSKGSQLQARYSQHATVLGAIKAKPDGGRLRSGQP